MIRHKLCVSLNVHSIIKLNSLIMKNLQKLKGAKSLSKNEQQSIRGGGLQKAGNVCSAVCPNSEYGRRCDIHAGCPGANDGMCNGTGGYFLL